MINKIYYKVEFTLASSMNIGNGQNKYSDKDIVRDGMGKPYIPGSSLAGIYRSFFDEKIQDIYFGGVNKSTESAEESKMIVYDATLCCDSQFNISIRDNVGLDEWKVAIQGSKFDYEVIEAGARFVTYFEFEGDEKISNVIARKWKQHDVKIGYKTMRGMGAVKDVRVMKKVFSYPNQLDEWLDFDMYEYKGWLEFSDEEAMQDANNHIIKLTLMQNSGISIRRYTTDYMANDDLIPEPDYESMNYKKIVDERIEDKPFIPGTSWSGAFLHNMKRVCDDSTDIEETFGYVSDSNSKKSKIRFGDTILEDAHSKIFTRNSIDRFSGGVVDNALYTEKFWYGGKGELSISFPRDEDNGFKRAFAATVADLHGGFMAVGGLTAIGRGLFKIAAIEIDGEILDISDGKCNEIYKALKKKLVKG